MAMREERPDVQALSGTDTHVYEAVAGLAVDGRPATVDEVVHATALPEETVRRSLDTLAELGWLKADGDTYVLGPHQWGLEY
jgi:DNA-binding IclR family transcriptional regulator